MSQHTENKSISIEDILKILHSEAHKMPLSPTSFRYLQALRSLTATSRNITQRCGEAESAKQKESSAPSAPHAPQRFNTASADTAQPILHTLLTDWLVSQWLMGVPFSTASLNLDIISALYGSAAKADLLPRTELFSELKAQLKQLGPKGWKSGINEEIFARALRLTKNAHRLLLDDSIAADLMLLSLTGTLTPIQDLALLPRDPHAKSQSKKGDDGGEESSRSRSLLPGEGSAAENETFASLRENRELLETMIARHAPNARRKYIFPLDQSKRSEAQIKKQVFKMTNALFRRARLPQSTDPNQTIESLWAYAALRTGIPASAVMAALGHAPLGLPILRLVPHAKPQSKKSVDNESDGGAEQAARELCLLKQDVESTKTFAPLREVLEASLREVGKVFLDNPARWYAMSLRPGVRFTQVCRRIEFLTKSEASNLKPEALSLFYPCEEIARAIGKKIVIKQRPFIHSVVFFKAKLTDIGPLFARIGDLAWCYRQSARPGAPYADISERQFRQFQQTIARFTPDYEVAPAGELDLKPNDRVEIVGGLFAGHEATFVKSEESRVKSEEANTVYRLNIVGENGIEWRIGVDSRLAKQKAT